jgi:hypothetical protein
MTFIPAKKKSQAAAGGSIGQAQVSGIVVENYEKGSGSTIVKSVTSPKPILPKKVFDEMASDATEEVVVGDSYSHDIQAKIDPVAKAYESFVGTPITAPVIVMTSEFVPLVGRVEEKISIDETSSVVSAVTALSALEEFDEVVDEIIATKKSIKERLVGLEESLSGIDARLADVDTALNVRTLSLGRSVGSLSDVLVKSGYPQSSVAKFANTKLWMQATIELKRALLAGSPVLFSSTANRQPDQADTDDSERILSDVTRTPSDYARVWINPYSNFDLPSIASFSSTSTLKTARDQLIARSSKLYVSLANANMTKKSPDSPQTQVFDAGGILSAYSGDMLNQYVSSGRDISILSSILRKEVTYSTFMSSQANRTWLASVVGYSVSSNDNFTVLDHLLGRFPRSIDEFSDTPIGLGNSLSSFSQESPVVDGIRRRVMTFEKRVPDGTTSGRSYYVDGTLTTADGLKFDTSRINALITRVSRVSDVISKIALMAGLSSSTDKSGRLTIFRDSEFGEFDIDTIATHLEPLRQIYDKVITTGNVYDQTTGESYDGLKVDVEEFKGLTQDERDSFRWPAMLCKACVQPVTSGYDVDDLKTHVFAWMMNLVLSRADGAQNLDVTRKARLDVDNFVATRVLNKKIPLSDLAYLFSEAHGLTFVTKITTTLGGDYAEASEAMKFGDKASDVETRSLLGSDGQPVGLWKIIRDLMIQAYTNKSAYSGDVTSFSGIGKTAYMYAYFDLLMRCVAALTPESLEGKFQHTSKTSSTTTTTLEGYAVYMLTDDAVNDTYVRSPDGLNSKRLKSAIDVRDADDEFVADTLAIFWTIVDTIGKTSKSLVRYVEKDFSTYLQTIRGVISSLNARAETRLAVENLAFTEGQVSLTRHAISEMIDRIDLEEQSHDVVRSSPIMSDVSDVAMLFMPVSMSDLLSYETFSSYFRSQQFSPKSGWNKRIMSVGIPPRAVRSLSGAVSRENKTGQSVIRVKVYMKDLLHPDVVYLPRSYLFDMRRYPTRCPAHWGDAMRDDDEINILSIPSKLVSNGEVTVCRDYNSGYPGSMYPSGLFDESERLEMYANCSISFLVEEYMRWFTRCRFDESTYTRFGDTDSVLENVKIQTPRLSSPPKKSRQSSPADTSIKYTDPASGVTYHVPTTKKKNSIQQDVIDAKRYDIPMTQTLHEYLKNLTFMAGSDVVLERVVHPRKFDRVFNLIVDPDDFLVDVDATGQETCRRLTRFGVLTDLGGSYRSKERTSGDVTFEEYFVTMEPYDYVDEAPV